MERVAGRDMLKLQQKRTRMNLYDLPNGWTLCVGGMEVGGTNV
jgi:hypothetical protein